MISYTWVRMLSGILHSMEYIPPLSCCGQFSKCSREAGHSCRKAQELFVMETVPRFSLSLVRTAFLFPFCTYLNRAKVAVQSGKGYAPHRARSLNCQAERLLVAMANFAYFDIPSKQCSAIKAYPAMATKLENWHLPAGQSLSMVQFCCGKASTDSSKNWQRSLIS